MALSYLISSISSNRRTLGIGTNIDELNIDGPFHIWYLVSLLIEELLV